MRKLNWRQIVSYIGIWILIAVFFSVLVYFAQAQLRANFVFSWRKVLLWQAIIYGWAILFPVINRFAVRFRVERNNWRKTVPVHLLAAFLFVLAHTFLYAVYYHFSQCLYAGEDCQFLANLRTFFFSNWLIDTSMYFLILSAVTARDYSRRFQAEQLKSSELKAALSDSQLRALKMQLQPHFLFNTLNSISALIHDDAATADRMVARLGDFLRLTLESSGENMVSFKQEMDFVNCYLEIEGVRFQDRLVVRQEIAPDVLETDVPNLILQPIIENAIRHGVSRQTGVGHLTIRAQRAGDKLRIEVEDNGPGLPAPPPPENDGGNGGIGLSNTRARLAHVYDGNHLFEIKNAVPHGLIVAMEIPPKTKSVRSPTIKAPNDDEGIAY